MRAAARAFVALASCAMLPALVIGGRWAEWLFALAVAAFPVAMILLAVRVVPRVGLAALALQLVGSAVALLLLSGGRVYVVGLPLSAVVALLGLGVGPLVTVVWTYARAFDARDAGG